MTVELVIDVCML